jgi:CubicO group peptidase (beta-lactamase class C family)
VEGDPHAANITPRHVLSHTTGLPNWREEEDSATLATLPTPGTRFGYSGEGYEYLQRAIEHITRQPLALLLHDTVLAPLGMCHSRFGWGADAAGEPMLDGDGIAAVSGVRTLASAAWSLLTTADDYARFLLAMLDPPAENQPGLSAARVAEMLTPQVVVGTHTPFFWGLGWGLQETQAGRAFWHWGGPQNEYASYAVAFPVQRVGVVVLTNGEEGHQLCEEVTQRALGMPSVAHPAFRWILPTHAWQADGRN